jgi:hypothetical protein
MPAWWSNLASLSTFNSWMEVVALFSAALTLICVLLLWRNGSQMVSYLIDREGRAGKRIKAVEKAAEQIRKELLTAQQHQDIVDQKRHVAEMDADAMRIEMDQMRKRYSAAEGALKERIDELKDIHITQGVTSGGVTTQSIQAPKGCLDAQQQKMLAKLLKTGPKGELDLISVLDDATSHETALEFKRLFDEQEWDTQNIIQSAFSNPPEGIVLVIHSKQTAPSYAKFLQRTLTTIGLPVSVQINDKYREWSISMIVGHIDAS